MLNTDSTVCMMSEIKPVSLSFLLLRYLQRKKNTYDSIWHKAKSSLSNIIVITITTIIFLLIIAIIIFCKYFVIVRFLHRQQRCKIMFSWHFCSPNQFQVWKRVWWMALYEKTNNMDLQVSTCTLGCTSVDFSKTDITVMAGNEHSRFLVCTPW